MVTSQAQLYSALGGLALETQKKALRAMAYYDHTPLRMLPENRLAELGIAEAGVSAFATGVDGNGVGAADGVCGEGRDVAGDGAGESG